MYYDGSISSRLRELQKELDTSYARVNFVHVLLGEAYNKIKDLEAENDRLQAYLNPDISPVNKTLEDNIPKVLSSTEIASLPLDKITDNIEENIEPVKSKRVKLEASRK